MSLRALLIFFALTAILLALGVFVFQPAPTSTRRADGERPAPSQTLASREEPEKKPETPTLPTPRFEKGQPVYVRIFKKESELELWLKADGRYALYRTFPICRWSGRLGPKLKEGDGQAPEGFYAISAKQLQPNSHYHLAFNVGYPNAFDRQNKRTGGLIMVHGDCVSIGCFAMTDKGIDEIYGFVAAALAAGQREVPVHIFPFRMTETALARETRTASWSLPLPGFGQDGARWSSFWRNLKEGYDLFQKTGEPPTAYACSDRYAFSARDASCSRVAGW